MAQSLLDRLSAEDYALIRSSVYYDPTSPTGLRWSRDGGRGKQVKKGDPAGASRPDGDLFIGQSCRYKKAAVILLLNDIWPSLEQNVATRVDAQGSWNQVENLRWASYGQSLGSSRESKRTKLVRNALGHAEPNLGERYRLNAPCKHGHTWENNPLLGLQRKQGNGWKCDECRRLHDNSLQTKSRQAVWREANRAEQNEKARKRMNARYHNESLSVREYQRQWKNKRHATVGRETRSQGLDGLLLPPGSALDVPRARIARELVAEGQPLDWEVLSPLIEQGMEQERERKLVEEAQRALQADERRNPGLAEFLANGGSRDDYEVQRIQMCRERSRQKHLIRYDTDPEYRLYHRQKSKRRKAQMRNSVAIQLSGKQINERFAEFDHRCAYCGAQPEKHDKLHIEHVLPISKGGTHALGNVLPACKSCNFSKRDHEAEQWYRQQPFFTETRWRKICRVLGWSRSSVGQMALL
jgi:hypothetical protein